MEEKTVAPVTEASAAATAPRKPMRKPARRKVCAFCVDKAEALPLSDRAEADAIYTAFIFARKGTFTIT